MPSWNPDNMPIGMTLEQLLYGLQQDGYGDKIFDPICLIEARLFAEQYGGVFLNNDLPSEAVEGEQLDGIVIPASRLTRTAISIQRVFNSAAGDAPQCETYEIDQYRRNGITNIVIVYAFTDGQTVTIFFNNPDLKPNLIAPTDMLVSWRVLLNRMDITIAVAPERGRELPIRTVAARVMKLVSKNSAAFLKRNKNYAERLQAEKDINDQIATINGQLEATARRVDTLSLDVTTAMADTAAAMKRRDALKAQVAALPIAAVVPPDENTPPTEPSQADTDSMDALDGLFYSAGFSAIKDGSRTFVKDSFKVEISSNADFSGYSASLFMGENVLLTLVGGDGETVDTIYDKIMAAIAAATPTVDPAVAQAEQAAIAAWNAAADAAWLRLVDELVSARKWVRNTVRQKDGEVWVTKSTQVDQPVFYNIDFEGFKTAVLRRDGLDNPLLSIDLNITVPNSNSFDEKATAKKLNDAANADAQSSGLSFPEVPLLPEQYETQVLNGLAKRGWDVSYLGGANTKAGGYSLEYSYVKMGDTITEVQDFKVLKDNVGIGRIESANGLTPDQLAEQIDNITAQDAAASNKPAPAPVENPVHRQMLNVDVALDSDGWMQSSAEGEHTKGIWSIALKETADGTDFMATINQSGDYHAEIGGGMSKTANEFLSAINDVTGDAIPAAVGMDYGQYVAVAADNVASLRPQDIYRVLDESGLSGADLQALADYIKNGNPDLNAQVDGDMAELAADRSAAPPAGDDLAWLAAAEADPASLMDQDKYAEFQAAATIDPRITTDPVIKARFDAALDALTASMLEAMKAKMSA